MTDIRKLTEEYVAAFNSRDLNKVENLLSENFELTDPEVTALTPKNNVLKYIRQLFDAHDSFRFETKCILVDENISVIHFTLTLGAVVLDGVDVITWKNLSMIKMEAYLTQRK